LLVLPLAVYCLLSLLVFPCPRTSCFPGLSCHPIVCCLVTCLCSALASSVFKLHMHWNAMQNRGSFPRTRTQCSYRKYQAPIAADQSLDRQTDSRHVTTPWLPHLLIVTLKYIPFPSWQHTKRRCWIFVTGCNSFLMNILFNACKRN
jgi:hypothetical protein